MKMLMLSYQQEANASNIFRKFEWLLCHLSQDPLIWPVFHNWISCWLDHNFSSHDRAYTDEETMGICNFALALYLQPPIVSTVLCSQSTVNQQLDSN